MLFDKPLLVYQEDDVVTQSFETTGAHCRTTIVQATHIGTRKTQQDSVFASDTTSFFPGEAAKVFAVVCDGMGGLEEGAEAGRIATDSLVRSLEELPDDSRVQDFFRETLVQVDESIAEHFGDGKAGTTAVIALLFGRRLYWCSVGDSRMYVLRENEITQITRDHNFYLQLLVDVADGKITAEEAEEHPDKEALISYVGSGDLTLIDVCTEAIILQSGDIILLCSDGLPKSLSDDQIKEIVYSNYGDLSEAVRLLPLVAFDTGGAKDNTSVVLIQYFE